MRLFWLFLPLLALPARLSAQAEAAPPPTDLVESADDAFGRRVGVEEIGLYGESEVRGFSLQSAGNYAIEGHYFVRASGLPPVGVDSTLIRVGINGLATRFAAPSGLVDLRLPRPGSEAGGSIEAGWWAGSGPVLIGRLRAGPAGGPLGIAGGIQLNPEQLYGDGSRGDYFATAAIPRWQPDDRVELGLVAALTWFRFESDTYFASPGRIPPRVRRNLYRGQDWMIGETNTRLAGLFGDLRPVPGWSLAASLFLSDSRQPRSAFNLLAFTGTGREADNVAVITGAQHSRAVSAELALGWDVSTGRAAHRLYAMVRGRDSRARTGAGTALTLGRLADVDAPPAIGEPAFVLEAGRERDEVRQESVGLGYALSLGAAFELRGDLQKTRYRRTVVDADRDREVRTSRPWLYSLSLLAQPAPPLALFASYARGLEESGAAPGNAANRGELLPAALARQAELGLRWSLAAGPDLIAGLFDIAKPLPGLDAAGLYRFVGEVRHRGIELSLAGGLTPRLSVLLGATFFQARLSGDLVERGEIGPEPVGRPERVLMADLSWRVPGVEGLSIDGALTVRGGREADGADRLRLPPYAILDLGLRQGFRIDGRPFSLRLRVGNLMNRFAWNVGSSGLYSHNGPRTFTLTVTGDF